MPRVSEWKFQDRHVQPSIDDFGVFIRAGSVLLAAGPPTLATRFAAQQNPTANPESLDDVAHPLGVVENFAMAQNKQLQTLFEIGSDLRYFLPGRTINNCALSRVLIDGPSLLKVAYNYYLPRGASEPTNGPLSVTVGNQATRPTRPIRSLPGQDHMFLNLASELFNLPIGILVMFSNNAEDLVAAVYLEKCMVNSHNMNINASSVLVAEALNLQFDRVLPINLINTTADKGISSV